jgi:hypothetical protein
MFKSEGDKVRVVAYLDVPAALVSGMKSKVRSSHRLGGLMRYTHKNVIHIDDFMSEHPSNPVLNRWCAIIHRRAYVEGERTRWCGYLPPSAALY